MTESEIIISNDASLDEDGWALLAPFGEWPKNRIVVQNGKLAEQRFVQVMDNEAADNLVAKEGSLFGRIRRALVGIPVYDGHPDLKDFAPETVSNNRSKNVIGAIDQVRKTARGVEGHFVLIPSGAAAVANGSQFPSALWLVQPFKDEGGKTFARPFKLLSAGLTANPNISGVESLANSNSMDTTIRDKFIGALIGKGVKLPDPASDDDLVSAIENGDFPGHPFRGNGATGGISGAKGTASNKASAAAHHASGDAFAEDSSGAHRAAAAAHGRAAAEANKAGKGALALHHDVMRNMHLSEAKSK